MVLNFLEKMAAKFLKSRMKGYALNLSVENPHVGGSGWIYGNGWHLSFGSK